MAFARQKLAPSAQIYGFTIALLAAMCSASSITYLLGGPSPVPLVQRYVISAFAITMNATTIWMFVRVAQLASQRAERPLQVMLEDLRPRFPLLVIPAVICPIFMAAFTATKSALAITVGFKFDETFADADSLIFGIDPWRLTHAALGPGSTAAIEVVYVHGWALALAYTPAFVVLFARLRIIKTFFTAMLLTWLVGGFAFAYLFPAAGPVFAHLSDAETGARFTPLKISLVHLLPADSNIRLGHAYLEQGTFSKVASYGGGISAMPSMHIAVAALYGIVSRGTVWFLPTCIFGAIILIGSIHTGYHYAEDAPAAVVITAACWWLSARWFAWHDAPPPGGTHSASPFRPNLS